MKKILYMLIVCLFVFSIAGCQYILPPIIQAGGTEIIKDTEETIPAKTVTPNIFEVEIIPPSPTVRPKDDTGYRWYVPTKEIRR